MKLTWTIKTEDPDTPEFLSDDVFYNVAVLLPQRGTPRHAFLIYGTPFRVERFGNSANVYVEQGNGRLRRVGLFTWGIEAQRVYAG